MNEKKKQKEAFLLLFQMNGRWLWAKKTHREKKRKKAQTELMGEQNNEEKCE